ncbi:MAG: cyclase family protein [Clostridiales bacterium]|jgi:kynurenine formamidase|nr:cyclase family protein [Clostridiales bacterium]
MKRYIDLSQDITHDMPVHPYDDAVRLYQDKFLDKDKYVNYRLEIGMHSGTHIDTPMHLTDRETYINEIPVDRFIGRGLLFDVRNESIIKLKGYYSDIVREDDIVLLYTGHSDRYGTKEYYAEQPLIDKDLANFFVEKSIKMLGMDLPSPDNYPFEIHKLLFDNNILIIENLTNLSELIDVKDFDVTAFPLKIRAEASMARVVACIDIK